MNTRLAYTTSTNDKNALAIARVAAAGRIKAEREAADEKRKAHWDFCPKCDGPCRIDD